MKKICLFVWCFLLISTVFAQSRRDSLNLVWQQAMDSAITASDVIFEGKEIANEYVWANSQHTQFTKIYHVLRVERIYRGHDKIKFGTLILVNTFGNIGKNKNKGIGHEGTHIVFGKLSTEITPFDTLRLDNTNKLSCLWTFDQQSETTGVGIRPYLEQLNTMEEARTYLSKYPNISMQIRPPRKIEDEGINRQKNEANLAKYNAYLEQKKPLLIELLEKKKRGENKNIYYKIGNEQLIEGQFSDEYWYQFDIMVKSNVEGTYLDNASVHLEYESGIPDFPTKRGTTPAFYEWSFKNNKIIVSPAPTFNNSSYKLNVADSSSSKLLFQLATPVAANLNRTAITTNYQALIRVKLRLLNLVETTKLTLSFDEINVFANTYTPDAQSDGLYWYDNFFFESLDYSMVAPVPTITSITPLSAAAGTGTLVTIKGHNFGADNPNPPIKKIGYTQRNAVFLKSADYASSTEPDATRYSKLDNLDAVDYRVWTDTLIQFQLPAFVHCCYRDYEGYLTPGTGKITVQNWNKKESKESTETLRIPYGIFARYDEALTKRKRLIPRINHVNGVKFKCDPKILKNQYALADIQQVFIDWSTALGIEVGFEKDVNDKIVECESKNNIDGNNVIYFGSDTDVMAVHHIFGKYDTEVFLCGILNNAEPVVGFRDADIEINSNAGLIHGKNYIGSKSFYRAFLHEVGHALGLTHSLEKNNLMYPRLEYLGNLDSAGKCALKGAAAIVALSANTTWTCDNLETLESTPNVIILTGTSDSGVIHVDINPNSKTIYQPNENFTYTVSANWNYGWYLYLFFKGGVYPYKQVGYGTFSGTMPASLPNYDWILNSDGNIMGKVVARGYMRSQCIGDTTYIGLVPNYPNLVPKISVTDVETNQEIFFSNGAGYVFGEIIPDYLLPCALGVPRIATFTLKNEGGFLPLQLTGSPKINVSGTGYTLLNADVPATIAKGDSFTFQVAFTPTYVGNYDGSISIANNDPTKSSAIIPLWGYGSNENVSKNQLFASHTPATNELNVAINTPIVATFDTPLSCALTENNLSVSGSFSGKITGGYTIEGNKISFKPNKNYFVGEVITVSLLKYIGTFKQENTFQFTVKANAPTSPSPLFHFVSSNYTDAYRETPNLISQDCNGDGKLDLVFGKYVLLNSGNANFTYTSNAIAPSNSYDSSVGDFNNDGLFDKISTNAQILTVSNNNGNGIFSLKSSIDVGLPIQSVRIADLNHDGYLDLVVGSELYSYTDISTAKVSILLNNCVGGFDDPVDYYFNESDSYYPTIGDFDGDNDLDIAVNGYGSGVYMLSNNGLGSFSSRLVYNYANGWEQNVYGMLACGDFDNDGDLDLAAADLDFEYVLVLLKSKTIANKSMLSTPQKTSVRIYSYQKTACVLNSTNGTAKVTIYDLLGRAVSEQQVSTGLQKIEVQRAGMYIVKVVSEIGTTTQRIIIRE